MFTGHFGSGKTEVAVNYAVNMLKHHNKVAIVDLDIVNPYFRTADAREHLESKSIRVLTTVYANTNVDVPALPPEVLSLFEDKEYKVVLDIGGDDLGAKVLSRYREEILQDSYEMFFVINTRRPMTATQEQIEEMIYEIETSARIKVTKLVNNTNVLEHTTARDIIRGHETVQRVSEKLNIPIGFVSGFGQALTQAGEVTGADTLAMDKLIRLPWE
jgi:hypothetical protein